MVADAGCLLFNLKIYMIGPIHEKDLIDIKQNTYLTLDTDTEGMAGIEMMTDTEEMINLTKRPRFGVTSVNLWVIIH